MKNLKKIIANTKGQALVILLFIVIIGFTIITAAIIFLYQNIKGSSFEEQGNYAYYIAESGIEEGMLRLLRNPNYIGTAVNQPLGVGGGNVTITVSSASGTITAIGTYNSTVRKIQAQTVYNNGVLTISSWKEIK